MSESPQIESRKRWNQAIWRPHRLSPRLAKAAPHPRLLRQLPASGLCEQPQKIIKENQIVNRCALRSTFLKNVFELARATAMPVP